MAAGIGNAAGYVSIYDGGVPRIITGYARENISGGVFVYGSTAADVVSSGLNSYSTADIKFCTDASGLACNGIALNSAASGALVSVATRGTFIVLADGTVTAGYPVIIAGANAVRNVTTGSVANTEYPIGRAITTGGSEGYVVIDLNL